MRAVLIAARIVVRDAPSTSAVKEALNHIETDFGLHFVNRT